jgi:hypothetical protein
MSKLGFSVIELLNEKLTRATPQDIIEDSEKCDLRQTRSSAEHCSTKDGVGQQQDLPMDTTICQNSTFDIIKEVVKIIYNLVRIG